MPVETTKTERLDRYRATRIWRSMDADRRRAAAEAFWRSDEVKDEDRAAAILTLATKMHFRPQTIRTAPPAKRAGYLAGCSALDDHVAGVILYAYHLARQVPLMARFLDALGIEHEDGRIKQEVEPPSREALEGAVESLMSGTDRGDAVLYLETLISQDGETWGGLAPILEEHAAKGGEAGG